MRFRFLALALVLALTGCGKQLTGRYEARAEIPQMPRMAGLDPKLQKQMDDAARAVNDMNRMTLEFNGSKVRMGSATAVTEYRYKIEGTKLEVISDAMGQKTSMPMTIEADGSISYSTLRFRKVE